MNNDKRELINQLCTQAGMIMEDYSAVALSIGSLGDRELKDRIDEILRAATRTKQLLDAVRALDG